VEATCLPLMRSTRKRWHSPRQVPRKSWYPRSSLTRLSWHFKASLPMCLEFAYVATPGPESTEPAGFR
jgi:hypothetical protein